MSHYSEAVQRGAWPLASRRSGLGINDITSAEDLWLNPKADLTTETLGNKAVGIRNLEPTA